MGQQIVYCAKCGSSLRHDDFQRSKAVVVDAISYCSACAPSSPSAPAARPEGGRPSISSTRVHAVAPGTRRRAREGGRKPPLALVLGAGSVVLGIVLLAVFLSGGSSSPPPAPPSEPPRTASPPPSASPAAETWGRLEKLAATADPDEVLLGCEAASKVLAGTAFEARLRALEAGTREKKRTRDAERQLALSLDDARKLMGSELRFSRPEEFRRLLDRLLALPGAHQAELRRMSETWEKQLKERETAAAPVDLSPLGPQGEIRQWLVLGTFPNTAAQDGLYADSLRSDSSHVPASGLEVNRKDGTRISWGPHSAPEGTVQFRRIAALGAAASEAPAVAFASCWLLSAGGGRIKFRVNADTGYRIRLNGEQLGGQPRGFELGKEPETYTATLVPGSNLVTVKVGTLGSPFGLRVRVTTIGSLTDRAPGVSVALQAGPPPRVLLKEDFESGPGRFQKGEAREVDGRKVLAIPVGGAVLENFTSGRVGPTTLLRFRLKVPAGYTQVCVLSWSAANGVNHWYHLRGLAPGEWIQATVPMKEMRGGYGMDGPALEGNVPSNLVVYLEVPQGATPPPLLIDDVEITE